MHQELLQQGPTVFLLDFFVNLAQFFRCSYLLGCALFNFVFTGTLHSLQDSSNSAPNKIFSRHPGLKAKGKYDSADELEISLNSLDTLLLKDHLEDLPIPALLNTPTPIRGRSEHEIFQNRLYDVNDFPAIKTAFGEDNTSRIPDKYAIFLYKHVWLKERK